MSTPAAQGISYNSIWSPCTRCLKRHESKFLGGTNGFFSCGEGGHMMKDCPKAKVTIIEGMQVASFCGDVEPQKKIKSYAIQSRQGQE